MTDSGSVIISEKNQITKLSHTLSTSIKAARLSGEATSSHLNSHTLTFSVPVKIVSESIDELLPELSNFYKVTFKRVYALAVVYDMSGRIFLEVDEEAVKVPALAKVILGAATEAHKQFSYGRQTIVMIKSTQESIQIGELSKATDLILESNIPWFQIGSGGDVKVFPTNM